MSLLSILYAVITLLINLVSGSQTTPGIATLIVALFFFSGVQLFFLGLVGEYILAIYGQVRQKPMVIERQRINFDAGGAERVSSATPEAVPLK